MFEATLEKGSLWKKVVEAMKDLVNETNFECTPQGISIQSVDSSHVALVSLSLASRGFEGYQCHRQQVLGINLANFSKLLKVIDDKDTVTLSHSEDTDILQIRSDGGEGKKTTEFSLKLMEIEQDSMGVPDAEMDYKAVLSMPSADFAKVCKDMSTFGDTMTIDITKERVRFSGTGDLGDGSITIMSTGSADKAPLSKNSFKNEAGIKGERGIKNEASQAAAATTTSVKKEVNDDDTIADAYQAPKASSAKTEASDGVYISCSEGMQLTFALRYLTTFSKGVALSDRVTLSLDAAQPCRVEFDMNQMGNLRWFLAPKVDDDSVEGGAE